MLFAVSLVEADSEEERWRLVHDNIEGFAGKELPMLDEVDTSEIESAWSNRVIRAIRHVAGELGVDLYGSNPEL